jgi:hypothetical protein
MVHNRKKKLELTKTIVTLFISNLNIHVCIKYIKYIVNIITKCKYNLSQCSEILTSSTCINIYEIGKLGIFKYIDICRNVATHVGKQFNFWMEDKDGFLSFHIEPDHMAILLLEASGFP